MTAPFGKGGGGIVGASLGSGGSLGGDSVASFDMGLEVAGTIPIRLALSG